MVKPLLTNLRAAGFRVVLERKASKVKPKSSRLHFFDKISKNRIVFIRLKQKKTRTPKQRRYSRSAFDENTFNDRRLALLIKTKEEISLF